MSAFSLSRSPSISSRVGLLSTERSVGLRELAGGLEGRSRSGITALSASTTRKYSNALTFTETLSREITRPDGHVQHHCAQIDAHHLLHIRHQQEQLPVPSAAGELAEGEQHRIAGHSRMTRIAELATARIAGT